MTTNPNHRNIFTKRHKPKQIRTYNNPFLKKTTKSSNNRFSMQSISKEDPSSIKLNPHPSTEKENKPRPLRKISKNSERYNQTRNTPKVSDFTDDLFANNPLAKAGLTMTGNYVKDSVMKFNKDGNSYAQKLFNSSFSEYFQINNEFLTRKVKFLLFPFLTKKQEDFSDESDELSGADHSHVPSVGGKDTTVFDLDLYIPMMAFTTYIILTCASLGLSNNFKPDMIFGNATNCFIVSLFETVVIKLIFLVFHNSQIGFFQMFSLAGYKYVGMCLMVILRVLNFSSLFFYVKYLAYIYVCAANFVSLYKSIDALQKKGSSSTSFSSGKGRLK